MDTTPAAEMKTEDLLPAHVDIDRQIATLRARQGELHIELTRREQEAVQRERAARGPDFPPSQHIGPRN